MPGIRRDQYPHEAYLLPPARVIAESVATTIANSCLNRVTVPYPRLVPKIAPCNKTVAAK
jgi:hypothetical protein